MEPEVKPDELDTAVDKYVEQISSSIIGEVSFGFSDFIGDMERSSEQESSVPIESNDRESGHNNQEADPTLKVFEDRQKRFLSGRKVSCDIVDAEGNVLVKAGTVIDTNIMELVKKKDKLVELIMNNTK